MEVPTAKILNVDMDKILCGDVDKILCGDLDEPRRWLVQCWAIYAICVQLDGPVRLVLCSRSATVWFESGVKSFHVVCVLLCGSIACREACIGPCISVLLDGPLAFSAWDVAHC